MKFYVCIENMVIILKSFIGTIVFIVKIKNMSQI